MNYVTQMIEDLEMLKDKYSRLTDMTFVKTEKDSEIFRQRLMLAGQSIINFYNEIFIPKYSEIKDRIVEEAGIQLSSFSDKASYCLKNNMPFAISIILTNPKDKINSRNNLERLIKKVTAMSQVKERAIV